MFKKKYQFLTNLGSDGNASFLRAARGGHLDKVLEYLKANTDINTSNANGLNALHLASKEGHVSIVTELLKRGANCDAATKKGNTALHIASLAGQEEIVKILVQHGHSVNVQSQNGFTPLYMAAQENHDNVVRFLLSNGANQSLATEDGFTPLAVALQQGHDKVVAVLLENDTRGKVRLPALHIAAKKDDTKAAALLLQNDHNPDVTSKSGFTPLHIAAHYGNESIANLLLQRGADVNYAAKHNITPLHVAAKWGKSNMVSLLLDRGANLESKTRDGLTPLHCAARSGHETVVDMLLERGAPISAKTKNGLAPLHMSSQGDHVDAARILLYHKAPVDEVTVDYLTALHVAAHCGHVRVAKLLLDRKADPNSRALNGFTPLHIACKKNRIKVVELLLKHGASIEATTESGLTPLHVASFMGCMNIVIYLIQHGASPDIPTVRGETPLHLAARANQTDIIRILLRNGAQVDARAREQQTPLHIAARLGNVDIVVLLLQHGAAVDATTKDMYTALHIAAKEGQEEVASVLLEHGASLTATTKKGFTPLHLAAKYGNMKVARLLLQRDAPVDSQGTNGVTPLHVASHYDHQNVALLLLDKGASPHAAAKNGYTPLHIAAKKNQMDIATTLLEYGAKTSAESKAGFTPLHLSAQEGHTDMSTLLIEHQAETNYQAKNGLTPLHLCAQEDRVNVAAILVKNKAEVDAKTKAGYTPLHVACHFGQINMVRFLIQHGVEVNEKTSLGYTPLHQAAQQGHTLIINLLLENKAQPNAVTNQGQTALSIAQKLGYISVVESLKVVTETIITTTTTTITEEKYKVQAPETMQETFMSDSEDEGGDDFLDSAVYGKPTHAQHVYLPYYEGQTLLTREDTMLGDQSYRYLTVDEMKSLGDDSLPIDVTRDEKENRDSVGNDYIAPAPVVEDFISPQLMKENYAQFTPQQYVPDNVDISRTPVHVGFLVSFMVDARGGAMRGCRHSGVRVIIPPRKAPMPMRITCRYLKKDKLNHPPPLMEGEAIASRILELGPAGAKFLGPVIIEVPHFASLRVKEREIVVLRSDNGETWREHTLEASEEAVQEVLNESFDGEDLNQLEDLNTSRITRILTTDFPQYFAIVSRIRQEVHAIGPEGGMVSSTVVPQVQAVFPQGALTKKIKVGLQAHPISAELVAKLLGNRVAVSPIVTVEPRRRKFHKPITLTIPVPQAAAKGMINQYSGDTPTLRLLCSITEYYINHGGATRAQWEDVTGSTPLTFVNDCVSFTTTVSARFWLMDCRNIGEATKMATELYKEAIHVPFMAKFVVFAKRHEIQEARLRVFCMTDDKEDKTLEHQEHFSEVAKSRDVEVLEGKPQYVEFAGNLIPVTKSGDQLCLNFHAFRENRLPFTVRVKDTHAEPLGRIAFMREPKVGRGEPPQTPVCNLNINLPENICTEHAPSEPDLLSLEKKYSFLRDVGFGKAETIHKADLRLSDICNLLGNDWVPLALQLDIPESDINIIKSEYPENVSQQAMVMLRLWMQSSGNKAAGLGNILEKALRKINREDIVNQCIFNVEMVTDEVEKAMAKTHLDQSGFDAFKEELGPSRDTSLRRNESLDESFDEQDIMKESESVEDITKKDQQPIPERVAVQEIPTKEAGYKKEKDMATAYERDEKKYIGEEKAYVTHEQKTITEHKDAEPVIVTTEIVSETKETKVLLPEESEPMKQESKEDIEQIIIPEKKPVATPLPTEEIEKKQKTRSSMLQEIGEELGRLDAAMSSRKPVTKSKEEEVMKLPAVKESVIVKETKEGKLLSPTEIVIPVVDTRREEVLPEPSHEIEAPMEVVTPALQQDTKESLQKETKEFVDDEGRTVTQTTVITTTTTLVQGADTSLEEAAHLAESETWRSEDMDLSTHPAYLSATQEWTTDKGIVEKVDAEEVKHVQQADQKTAGILVTDVEESIRTVKKEDSSDLEVLETFSTTVGDKSATNIQTEFSADRSRITERYEASNFIKSLTEPPVTVKTEKIMEVEAPASNVEVLVETVAETKLPMEDDSQPTLAESHILSRRIAAEMSDDSKAEKADYTPSVTSLLTPEEYPGDTTPFDTWKTDISQSSIKPLVSPTDESMEDRAQIEGLDSDVMKQILGEKSEMDLFETKTEDEAPELEEDLATPSKEKTSFEQKLSEQQETSPELTEETDITTPVEMKDSFQRDYLRDLGEGKEDTSAPDSLLSETKDGSPELLKREQFVKDGSPELLRREQLIRDSSPDIKIESLAKDGSPELLKWEHLIRNGSPVQVQQETQLKKDFYEEIQYDRESEDVKQLPITQLTLTEEEIIDSQFPAFLREVYEISARIVDLKELIATAKIERNEILDESEKTASRVTKIRETVQKRIKTGSVSQSQAVGREILKQSDKINENLIQISASLEHKLDSQQIFEEKISAVKEEGRADDEAMPYVSSPVMQRKHITAGATKFQTFPLPPVDVTDSHEEEDAGEEKYYVTDPVEEYRHGHRVERVHSSPDMHRLAYMRKKKIVSPLYAESGQKQETGVKTTEIPELQIEEVHLLEVKDQSEVDKSNAEVKITEIPELQLEEVHLLEIEDHSEVEKSNVEVKTAEIPELHLEEVYLPEVEQQNEVEKYNAEHKKKQQKKERRIERRFERMSSQAMEEEDGNTEQDREMQFQRMASEVEDNDLEQTEEQFELMVDAVLQDDRSEEWGTLDSQTPEKELDSDLSKSKSENTRATSEDFTPDKERCSSELPEEGHLGISPPLTGEEILMEDEPGQAQDITTSPVSVSGSATATSGCGILFEPDIPGNREVVHTTVPCTDLDSLTDQDILFGENDFPSTDLPITSDYVDDTLDDTHQSFIKVESPEREAEIGVAIATSLMEPEIIKGTPEAESYFRLQTEALYDQACTGLLDISVDDLSAETSLFVKTVEEAPPVFFKESPAVSTGKNSNIFKQKAYSSYEALYDGKEVERVSANHPLSGEEIKGQLGDKFNTQTYEIPDKMSSFQQLYECDANKMAEEILAQAVEESSTAWPKRWSAPVYSVTEPVTEEYEDEDSSLAQWRHSYHGPIPEVDESGFNSQKEDYDSFHTSAAVVTTEQPLTGITYASFNTSNVIGCTPGHVTADTDETMDPLVIEKAPVVEELHTPDSEHEQIKSDCAVTQLQENIALAPSSSKVIPGDSNLTPTPVEHEEEPQLRSQSRSSSSSPSTSSYDADVVLHEGSAPALIRDTSLGDASSESQPGHSEGSQQIQEGQFHSKEMRGADYYQSQDPTFSEQYSEQQCGADGMTTSSVRGVRTTTYTTTVIGEDGQPVTTTTTETTQEGSEPDQLRDSMQAAIEQFLSEEKQEHQQQH